MLGLGRTEDQRSERLGFHSRWYWWPFTHWFSGDNQSERSLVPVVSKWLGPGNKTFLEVASMVAFLHSVHSIPYDIQNADSLQMNAATVLSSEDNFSPKLCDPIPSEMSDSLLLSKLWQTYEDVMARNSVFTSITLWFTTRIDHMIA